MNDSHKSEAQLKEELAELHRQRAVEQAAERIREAVLAMRHSEDIEKVTAVMFRALVGLGVETPVCNCLFIDEENELLNNYVAYARHRPIDSAQLAKGRRLLGEDVISHRTQMTFSRFHTAYPDLPDFFESWKERKAQSFKERLAELDWKDKFLEKYPELEGHPIVEGEWIVTNVPFTHGVVGFREREYSEEQVAVVQRLTEALSLGYLRFLDFQNLERQNRDLEEERALEKVRTRVAAMQTSGDLQRVVKEIERMLKGLSIPCDAVGINIIDEEAGEIHLFQEDGISETGVYSGLAVRLFGHWKQGVMWSRSGEEQICGISGRSMLEELRANWDRLNREKLKRGLIDHGISDRDISEWAETGDLPVALLRLFEQYVEWLREYYGNRWIVDIPFSHGTLAINRLGVEPFVDEDLRLFERFTEVFELAYARFLDLQAAEKNARRAKRQAAVDRLRAGGLAMRSREDMLKLAVVLFEEMRGLGVKTSGCNYHLRRRRERLRGGLRGDGEFPQIRHQLQ